MQQACHKKPQCPELRNRDGGNNNGGNNNDNNNTGGDGGSGGGSDKGKWAPPKSGESEKKTIDGKERFWCSKCREGKGMWNLTHVTSNHKTKEQLAAARAAGGGNNNGTGTGNGARGNVAQVPFTDLEGLLSQPCDQGLYSLDQWKEE